jgi:hypothetical protein
MDDNGWETVTRKDKKRSSFPTTATYSDDKSRSRATEPSGSRTQSRSPPPNRIPSPNGQHSSRKPKRQSHDSLFPVIWGDVRAFSSQPERKAWQEYLVQSTERPRCAKKAVIRAGVHVSREDPSQHITVEYQKSNDDHVTTWHVDLTEAEYQTVKRLERSDRATLAVEPLPTLAWGVATLSSPPSP